MSAKATALRTAYTLAFRAFLEDESETALHAAYELGRDAVSRELGLLDLAHAHHEALLAELAHAAKPDDALRLTRAAADFLLEALSAYEMVRRGLAETLETVAVERRQAAMLRQLSTLLADATLAVHSRSSIEEVLQLVAEQVRELTHAAWCLAHADIGLGDVSTTVAHAGSAPPGPANIVREALAALDQGAASTAFVDVETRSARGRVLAAPLATLDEHPFGVLAIAAEEERDFTELDRAVLVHIGQMTAAAIERATSYHR
jgi:GAF domain-containing protein